MTGWASALVAVLLLAAHPHQLFRLQDNAIGASSGLGRCIALGLAGKGARVALLARRRERLVQAAKEAGNGAEAVVCDVTDEQSCRDAIATAAAGWPWGVT